MDNKLTVDRLTGIVLLLLQVKHIGAPTCLCHSFTVLKTASELSDIYYIIMAIKLESWALATDEYVAVLASLWFLNYLIFINHIFLESDCFSL